MAEILIETEILVLRQQVIVCSPSGPVGQNLAIEEERVCGSS